MWNIPDTFVQWASTTELPESRFQHWIHLRKIAKRVSRVESRVFATRPADWEAMSNPDFVSGWLNVIYFSGFQTSQTSQAMWQCPAIGTIPSGVSWEKTSKNRGLLLGDSSKREEYCNLAACFSVTIVFIVVKPILTVIEFCHLIHWNLASAILVPDATPSWFNSQRLM